LFSPKASSYDGQQNTVKVGDTVKVITGPHEKLSGTIKHMMKGMLWLHSNSYLKNSGIFVVKSKKLFGGLLFNLIQMNI
jgi:transcription elongation factor